MSSSFKRVISHPDELGNISKKVTMEEENAKELAAKNASTRSTSPSTPPAVVEVDDVMVVEEENEAKLGPHVGAYTHSSTASSLSDRSHTEAQLEKLFNEEMISIQEDVAGVRRNYAQLPSASNLTRVESTKSVDSWGWFQDVHGSEGNKNNSFKRKTNNDDDGPAQMVDISHPNRNGTLLRRFTRLLQETTHHSHQQLLSISIQKQMSRQSRHPTMCWKRV
jgi:hypothetical protein